MSTHEPSANMAKALGMHSCLHASHTGLAHQQDQPMHGLEPASGQGESMQGCMGLQADGMDMHCDLDLPDVGRSSSPFANGDLFADQQVNPCYFSIALFLHVANSTYRHMSCHLACV